MAVWNEIGLDVRVRAVHQGHVLVARRALGVEQGLAEVETILNVSCPSSFVGSFAGVMQDQYKKKEKKSS